MVLGREAAIGLWEKYNDNEALRQHALAVEGCMRHMARKAGQDEELWGVVGLLHDIDYQR